MRTQPVEASASGVGQVVNFLAHFGAQSGQTMVLLRTGQLGRVLQITKAGRASPDENCHCIGYLLSAKHGFAHWLSTSRVQGKFAKRPVM